jgi:hypothetical protein
MRSRQINPQAVNESQIIQALEVHAGGYKEYLELGGGELGDEYRTQALRNMPTGDLRKHIRLQFPDGNSESLRQQVHGYAMLQIKDSRTARSAVAGVTQECYDDYDNFNGQHANNVGHGSDYNNDYGCDFSYDDAQVMDSEGNIGALGKGKGFGGKGFGGKGLGKNGGKPSSGNYKGQGKGKPGMGNYDGCHNCGSKQHMIRDCPHPRRPKGDGKGQYPNNGKGPSQNPGYSSQGFNQNANQFMGKGTPNQNYQQPFRQPQLNHQMPPNQSPYYQQPQYNQYPQQPQQGGWNQNHSQPMQAGGPPP